MEQRSKNSKNIQYFLFLIYFSHSKRSCLSFSKKINECWKKIENIQSKFVLYAHPFPYLFVKIFLLLFLFLLHLVHSFLHIVHQSQRITLSNRHTWRDPWSIAFILVQKCWVIVIFVVVSVRIELLEFELVNRYFSNGSKIYWFFIELCFFLFYCFYRIYFLLGQSVRLSLILFLGIFFSFFL